MSDFTRWMLPRRHLSGDAQPDRASVLATVIHDAAGNITFWSRGAEQLYGYTREQALGRSHEALLQPQYLSAAPSAEGLERNGGWAGDVVHLARDGTKLVIASQWVGDSDPKTGARTVIATNRVRGDARPPEWLLQNNESWVRLAAEAAGMVAWEMDFATQYVRCSENALGIWGFTEGPGETFLKCVHPDDRATMLERTRAAAAGARGYELEYRIIAASGEVRWVQSRGDIVRDASGKIVRFVGVTFDVTERKRAFVALSASEQRVRESEAILRAFCDSSPLLMGLVEVCEGDQDLLHLYGNPATDAFFGVERGATTGRRASELGAPPEHIAHWIGQYRVAERDGAPVRFEYPHQTAERTRWLVCIVSRVAENVGSRPRFSFVVADITDQKDVEFALRDAQAALERHATELEATVERRTNELRSANAEMEAVLYSVAHDLRAPLRSIAGFAEVLQVDHGEQLSPPARHLVTRIVSAGTVMDQLLGDLLEFGGVARDITLAPTSLTDAWRLACLQCSSAISQRGGTVDADADLPDVIAHAPTLTQILANLLGNALKFAKPGTTPFVQLRAERSGDRVRVIVADHGIGIPPEHHARIFGLFERLSPKTSEGTGVGLAIVRKGAERMHAEYGVESQVGEGSRFWIELAIANA